MYEIKTKDVCEFLTMIRKCVILVITQLSQNIMAIQRN